VLNRSVDQSLTFRACELAFFSLTVKTAFSKSTPAWKNGMHTETYYQ